MVSFDLLLNGILILVFLNYLVLLFRNIYKFGKELNLTWNQIKTSSKKSIKIILKKIKVLFKKSVRLKFRHYFLIASYSILILMFMFHIDDYYKIMFLILVIITLFFIIVVRDILKKRQSEGFSEFSFFIYICLFSLILISYIIAFSLFYFHAFSIGHGYITKNNVPISLNRTEALFYSGFTFFSMGYNDFNTHGILSLFSFAEVFCAQIILITYIGIIAGIIMEKLNLVGE